ncbi:hypothetical protein HYH02_003557 [Chlamydomonas schloesseri]|uniref:RRM domain-containing protein n=1 Tax=Chlamydomonas schloesseri TaxID=2026947 RepID=A0A836BA45_9CHLO|nr:hypothetical protein HYH02_003557 [Chlamydomonas schloesseri]|eukprot:KAG2451779.1 hypothetical protein HYH02_003557 [Chlamydomonas schloesseri]
MAAGMSCWPAAPAGPQSVMGPSRSLFAKGLAKGCTSAHLHAIFSNFGVVTDCQIARHRSGRSAGFAIVTFLRHEEAVAAMQAVDNLMFMGRRLSVKWFSPERALEGNVGGVADVLNMQALQQALQLSAQLQPADLMTQLAQMLEPARPQPTAQQPQNPHVAAWLDNFMMAQHQEPQLAAPQRLLDPQLLNLSALSLADVPAGPAPVAPRAPVCPSTGLDAPDGAVFVSASAPAAAADKTAAASDLGHSRLAKWCAAPGSATAASSAAPSLADDAGSETASVHASDDSSVATTATIQLATAAASTDGPRSSCDASSPAASTEPSETAAGASSSTGGSAPSAAPASTRPSVLSDPGALCAVPALPGAPSLAPLRTSAMPQALPRAAAPMPQTATCFRPGPLGNGFGSCGGVASSAGASPTEAAALQQAMRLQQMLAEQQARNAQAAQQQQYVEALAKLVAAREQVMAAATMLNGGNPALAAQQQHHQQLLQLQQQQQQAHLLGGGHRAHPHPAAAMGVNPFMQQPAGAQQPDLSALLLLQNAAALNRPLF